MKTFWHASLQIIIIFTLLWHPTAKAENSSPQVVELTPEQMQEVLKKVKNSDQVKIRYAVADENGKNEEIVLKSKAEEEEEDEKAKEEKEQENDSSAGGALAEFLADLATGMMGSWFYLP